MDTTGEYNMKKLPSVSYHVGFLIGIDISIIMNDDNYDKLIDDYAKFIQEKFQAITV